MMEAWRPLIFADEELEEKKSRDPVSTAQRSEAALEKVKKKTLPDGSPVHSFRSLVDNLATIVRNTCSRKDSQEESATFTIDTQPSELQVGALKLIKSIKM